MKKILDIIEREINNDTKIYIYEENDKWHAYQDSAEYICTKKKNRSVLNSSYIDFFGLKIKHIEVDLKSVLNEKWQIETFEDEEIIFLR